MGKKRGTNFGKGKGKNGGCGRDAVPGRVLGGKNELLAKFMKLLEKPVSRGGKKKEGGGGVGVACG